MDGFWGVYHAVELRFANDHVAAHRLHETEQLRVLAAVGDHVDRLDAARFAQLQHGKTHRRRGIVLHDEVAALEGSEVGEESVGESCALEKRRRDLGGNAFGGTDHLVFRHHDLLAPGAFQ